MSERNSKGKRSVFFLGGFVVVVVVVWFFFLKTFLFGKGRTFCADSSGAELTGCNEQNNPFRQQVLA